MTPEQQAAYITAMAACVVAEVAAMQAENTASIAAKAQPNWNGDDFRAVLDKYGAHHNAVMSVLR
jgi:hypothetical protein